MLLFKKKDLLVVISKSGTTVQFTKPLKDILKYQHRYNYKFKLYENGKVTTADDYIIDGETLTVLFGSAVVTYTSEGATYTEGSGGGSGGGGCDCKQLVITVTGTEENPVSTPNLSYDEMDDITGGLLKVEPDLFYVLGGWVKNTDKYDLYFLSFGVNNTPIYIQLTYNSDGTITPPSE